MGNSKKISLTIILLCYCMQIAFSSNLPPSSMVTDDIQPSPPVFPSPLTAFVHPVGWAKAFQEYLVSSLKNSWLMRALVDNGPKINLWPRKEINLKGGQNDDVRYYERETPSKIYEGIEIPHPNDKYDREVTIIKSNVHDVTPTDTVLTDSKKPEKPVITQIKRPIYTNSPLPWFLPGPGFPQNHFQVSRPTHPNPRPSLLMMLFPGLYQNSYHYAHPYISEYSSSNNGLQTTHDTSTPRVTTPFTVKPSSPSTFVENYNFNFTTNPNEEVYHQGSEQIFEKPESILNSYGTKTELTMPYSSGKIGVSTTPRNIYIYEDSSTHPTEYIYHEKVEEVTKVPSFSASVSDVSPYVPHESEISVGSPPVYEEMHSQTSLHHFVEGIETSTSEILSSYGHTNFHNEHKVEIEDLPPSSKDSNFRCANKGCTEETITIDFSLPMTKQKHNFNFGDHSYGEEKLNGNATPTIVQPNKSKYNSLTQSADKDDFEITTISSVHEGYPSNILISEHHKNKEPVTVSLSPSHESSPYSKEKIENNKTSTQYSINKDEGIITAVASSTSTRNQNKNSAHYDKLTVEINGNGMHFIKQDGTINNPAAIPMFPPVPTLQQNYFTAFRPFFIRPITILPLMSNAMHQNHHYNQFIIQQATQNGGVQSPQAENHKTEFGQNTADSNSVNLHTIANTKSENKFNPSSVTQVFSHAGELSPVKITQLSPNDVNENKQTTTADPIFVHNGKHDLIPSHTFHESGINASHKPDHEINHNNISDHIHNSEENLELTPNHPFEINSHEQILDIRIGTITDNETFSTMSTKIPEPNDNASYYSSSQVAEEVGVNDPAKQSFLSFINSENSPSFEDEKRSSTQIGNEFSYDEFPFDRENNQKYDPVFDLDDPSYYDS